MICTHTHTHTYDSDWESVSSNGRVNPKLCPPGREEQVMHAAPCMSLAGTLYFRTRAHTHTHTHTHRFTNTIVDRTCMCLLSVPFEHFKSHFSRTSASVFRSLLRSVVEELRIAKLAQIAFVFLMQQMQTNVRITPNQLRLLCASKCKCSTLAQSF